MSIFQVFIYSKCLYIPVFYLSPLLSFFLSFLLSFFLSSPFFLVISASLLGSANLDWSCCYCVRTLYYLLREHLLYLNGSMLCCLDLAVLPSASTPSGLGSLTCSHFCGTLVYDAGPPNIEPILPLGVGKHTIVVPREEVMPNLLVI